MVRCSEHEFFQDIVRVFWPSSSSGSEAGASDKALNLQLETQGRKTHQILEARSYHGTSVPTLPSP